jgi:hypothetical protein
MTPSLREVLRPRRERDSTAETSSTSHSPATRLALQDRPALWGQVLGTKTKGLVSAETTRRVRKAASSDGREAGERPIGAS